MPEDLVGIFFSSFFKVLLPFWWVFVLAFLVYLVKEIVPIILKKRKRNEKFSLIDQMHSDRELLRKIKSLKPSEFEDFIAVLYNRLGYNTEKVGRSHDGGIDVIAEKNGVKYYIQCKKFITQKVSVGAVRDFYGAMFNLLASNKGIFITTNIFTTEAEKFAEDNPIELIDGNELIKLVRLSATFKKTTPVASVVSPVIQVKEPEIKKCPKCGGALVTRKGKKGEFIGCSNFPKCWYKEY